MNEKGSIFILVLLLIMITQSLVFFVFYSITDKYVIIENNIDTIKAQQAAYAGIELYKDTPTVSNLNEQFNMDPNLSESLGYFTLSYNSSTQELTSTGYSGKQSFTLVYDTTQ